MVATLKTQEVRRRRVFGVVVGKALFGEIPMLTWAFHHVCGAAQRPALKIEERGSLFQPKTRRIMQGTSGHCGKSAGVENFFLP